MAAPAQIVILRDCVVDRWRVRVRAGGGAMPLQAIPEESEQAAFWPGALQVRDFSALDRALLRGYQRKLLGGADRDMTLVPEASESVATFAVERQEYVKPLSYVD